MSDIKSTICPMPFNSIAYNITGKIGPCTQCDLTSFKNLKDYWVCDDLKKLRSDMKNGIRNPACNECYRREDTGAWNMRQYLIKEYPDFDFDNETPAVEQVWLRMSNLCNYLCIDCIGATSSSIWKEDIDRGSKPKTTILIHPGGNPETVVEQVKEIAPTLKNVNFSGGEPLLHWQHWDMLNHMIDIGVNPKIGYFTNLSMIKFKGQKLTDALNHFSDVEMTVGFDAMGDGCDYFRKNMSWHDTLKNIETIQTEAPHVKFTLAVTYTWMNAVNASKMIVWFRKNHPELMITLNLVIHEYLDMRVAPNFKKIQIEQALKDAISSNTLSQINVEMANSFINYLWGDDHSERFGKALQWIKSMDEWRGKDFRDAFPEHRDIRYEEYQVETPIISPLPYPPEYRGRI
jgi:pyruvate-formate lyase-activating enzyme